MADPDGAAQLRALGSRSLPVVSRGSEYVFAQVIKDVVEFLELDEDTAPELSADELKTRYARILDIAIEQTRLMPDDALTRELPNRPRSWLVLLHHVFQVPVAFLDMEDTGEELSYENMVGPPPDDMKTSAQIAEFGESVRARFNAWADRTKGESFDVEVPTYFGGASRHEMLERAVWHSTQHARQVGSLLEQVNVSADRSISADDIAGLPLTEAVWDTSS